MHDITEFTTCLTFSPRLSVKAHIESIFIDSSRQILSYGRSITEATYFHFIPHINNQWRKCGSTPNRFPVPINSLTGICIATNHLPSIDRYIAELYFFILICKRFCIEKTDRSNISHTTGRANGYTNALRTSIRETYKTFISYCCAFCHMNPGTIFIRFYKETFNTLSFGDIFLNHESIHQRIFPYIILADCTGSSMPCLVSFQHIITGKSFL